MLMVGVGSCSVEVAFFALGGALAFALVACALSAFSRSFAAFASVFALALAAFSCDFARSFFSCSQRFQMNFQPFFQNDVRKGIRTTLTPKRFHD